ncbi:hypothetical protein [Rhizobium mesoamericanum]|uniref:hypothetical protein n=1 Tax=Rhizobium mesoamericanum TaxID=1079800 RepID=UPI0003F8D438|nr:hypothetical protein [Rhizobium mesoamericanum]
MTAHASIRTSDGVSILSLTLLAVITLLVAAESHAFCSIFCIHGGLIDHADICSGRS